MARPSLVDMVQLRVCRHPRGFVYTAEKKNDSPGGVVNQQRQPPPQLVFRSPLTRGTHRPPRALGHLRSRRSQCASKNGPTVLLPGTLARRATRSLWQTWITTGTSTCLLAASRAQPTGCLSYVSAAQPTSPDRLAQRLRQHPKQNAQRLRHKRSAPSKSAHPPHVPHSQNDGRGGFAASTTSALATGSASYGTTWAVFAYIDGDQVT